jgi:hypothetical protein
LWVITEAPILVELEIRGIPSHAWEQRTADVLLQGSGLVESVDANTMNRYDMSCFPLTAWTHSVDAIPAARWLAVPEPEAGDKLQVSAAPDLGFHHKWNALTHALVDRSGVLGPLAPYVLPVRPCARRPVSSTLAPGATRQETRVA